MSIENPFGSGDNKDFIGSKQARARHAVLKILVAVVVAFIVCWVPFHTQRLLNIFQVEMDEFTSGFLFYFSGIFYYFSAVVNPLLYGIMSAKYRRSFIDTFSTIGAKCFRKSFFVDFKRYFITFLTQKNFRVKLDRVQTMKIAKINNEDAKE